MALRWTVVETEPTAPQVPVVARRPVGLAASDGHRAEVSLAEAVQLLGRRGYVRVVEAAGTMLWCPSCATPFEPTALLVGAVVSADGGTVIGLRDPATGAGVVWVLRDWTEEERRLVRRLRWRPLARRRRVTGQRPRRAGQPVT